MSSRRQFLQLDRFLDLAGPLSISTACVATQQVACRNCVEECAEHALQSPPGRPARPRLDTARCTRCGDCLSVCPTQALRLIPESERCCA